MAHKDLASKEELTAGLEPKQEEEERRKADQRQRGEKRKGGALLDRSKKIFSSVDLLYHHLLQKPLVEVLSHPLAPRIHQVHLLIMVQIIP